MQLASDQSVRRGKDRVRIPFSCERAMSRKELAYFAFIFAKPSLFLSRSSFLSCRSWLQVPVGARDYRYRLPPPLTSRTTVLRNAGNWRSREREGGTRGRKKKTRPTGGKAEVAFYEASFTIFLRRSRDRGEIDKIDPVGKLKGTVRRHARRDANRDRHRKSCNGNEKGYASKGVINVIA